jgi:NAD(P)-dependent dehydrogenase (short-subunit alcohol dehydrogenase family)
MTRDSRIKNALVTGDPGRIGKEVGRGLARGGYVVITARRSLLPFKARMVRPMLRRKERRKRYSDF